MADLTDLRAYLDASPSPWHATANAALRLLHAGFQPLAHTDHWLDAPGRGFTVRDAALVAWSAADDADATSPFRLVGAHTDSPCLRVKPLPDAGQLGWKQLAVEVYGGALLNSWLDRDLGVAGRVVLADGAHADLLVDSAICRVPQLAIHLDRDVNERGLVLDKQAHLTPVWGTGAMQRGEFRAWVAEQLGVAPTDVATWDLSLFDITPSVILGADESLLASGRLDNQLSCWAATDALTRSTPADGTVSVVALFDHEEVGSQSTGGAAGPLLEHVIERLSAAWGDTRPELLTRLGKSFCVSADNAHAVHPNYAERHEPDHRPMVNHGPAIKINANQRYASSASSAARVAQVFREAGVPFQTFVSRNNMPCGSTIGPITATRLGIDTVDVGVPQLSMHSARELCGVHDPLHLSDALVHFFAQ
jgi:aspartyl aminopeptidase